MLKLVTCAFNMQRLDKILRKKFPKEMTGKNTALLVGHWISDNAICTVKERSLPSDNASLFVQVSWAGDSRCGERWYQLDTHGVVMEFNH